MQQEIKAEMSGTVWKLLVNVGEAVSPAQEVVILESMKMEVPIESPCQGTVTEVCCAPDQFVDEGATLIIVETD